MSDITSIYQTISINKGTKNLARMLHDPELWKIQFTHPDYGQFYQEGLGWDWRVHLPEIYTLGGSHNTPMNESWQYTSFDINPLMSPKQWRVLYDHFRAFTNGLGKGFDTRNFFMRVVQFMGAVWNREDESFMASIPRALNLAIEYVPLKDYINKIDLKPDSTPLMRQDKSRLTGGHTFECESDGDDWIVKTFDGNSDSPQERWLADNPSKGILDFIEAHKFQLMHAVSIERTAAKEPRIIPFPQNGGRRVLVPLMTRREVRIPKGATEKVTKWKDPYTVFFYP